MILVIDFEATCDANDAISPSEMEIIEIGAVWADFSGNISDSFQRFVKPIVHHELTPFCKELTGICQSDLDNAQHFNIVAMALTEFSQLHLTDHVWGSWGAYDRKQIAIDSERHGIINPLHAWEHINLKANFAKLRKQKQIGMKKALELVGLNIDGAHHRGLDDARNISKLIPYCFKS